MTLIELVQSLLASMESDEVDSINDTVEGYNVALLCRDVFYDACTDLALDEQDRTVHLVSAANINTPTLFTVPPNVTKLYWVKYNQSDPLDINPTFPLFMTVQYVCFPDFLTNQQALRQDTLASAGGDVAEQTIVDKSGNSFPIPYRTNAFPQFYTTFDNNSVLFDSYRQDIESTMQSSNTLCAARIFPEFQLADTFVPPFDSNQFAYYRNKCKVQAFAEFKQMPHQVAIENTKRQKQVVVRDRDRVDNRPAVLKLQARYGRRGGWTNNTINYNGN